jgi:hypothetical protein
VRTRLRMTVGSGAVLLRRREWKSSSADRRNIQIENRKVRASLDTYGRRGSIERLRSSLFYARVKAPLEFFLSYVLILIGILLKLQ